ncbi:MAG TPA: ADP-dependent glucokinase/phosphofructokinase [Anaerolineae bacterium]|nr:ADP-dependent glucokinase/phosphofructokinase [Anaerolineae bacterium]
MPAEKRKRSMNERIALGFGNNIDYEIVWNSKVIENLIIQYEIHNDDLDINKAVNSERDLVISILSFLQSGTGGERIVSASAILEQFSQSFERRITLGGTPVRAAIAMRKLGYTSALHLVTINDHVRSLIPQDSPYVCSSTEDGLYPHLIVQFGKDTRVKAGDIDLCASQANRIIYHKDDDNIIMNLNEDFSHLLTEAKVLLISGFNAMQSEALLVNRLASLARIMEKLPQEALVYYEDAGYHEPRFSHLIFRTLARKISIVSLNEDELQAYVGRRLDLLDVFQIESALADLQKLIPGPVIVVHSRYWALAYGENAASFSNALKGGMTMATTRFCCGDDFTVADYQRVEALSPNRAGAIFAETLNRRLGRKVCCLPVAHVEPLNATTVGLGDAFVGGFLPALLS